MRKFFLILMLLLPNFNIVFAQLVATNLPIIKINVEPLDTYSDEYKIGDMQVIWNEDGLPNMVDGTPNNYDGKIAIKVRGSSSRYYFPKLQYRIETQDENGDNLNVSLLGMPKENDWILYAPYSDKTLMRNVLTYELGRQINDWAPRTRFCEVILNGDYVGVYVLMENIKRDGDRVDIFELLPEHNGTPEITGGYLFAMDRIDPGEPFLELTSGLKFKIKEPDEITENQKTYLKYYLNNFENALYGNGDFNDFIDAESFAINFLMVEFAKNIDGYRLSTFFHKDIEGKVVAGPVWDYNLSFGNADYYDGWKAEGWYYNLIWDSESYWFKELFENHDDFQELCRETWIRLRQKEFNIPNVYKLMDDWAEELKYAQARNFVRWPTLGQYVWPNPGYPESQSWDYKSGAPTTWLGEIQYMKDFIRDRIAWMDEQFNVNFADFTLNIEQTNFGSVLYNNKEYKSDVNLGAVLKNSDIILEAIPAAGYQFKNWKENILSSGTQELIEKSTDWKYLDNGTFPGINWYKKDFVDILWKTGKAELGYGDGDEQTTVSYGPNSQSKYITTYFRKKFTVIDASNFENLKIGLVADDGAVVYLNEMEVYRYNMPDGSVNNTTLATDFVSDAQESVFNEFDINPELLIEGENLIAVEIHQNNAESSDISFNLEMCGNISTDGCEEIIGESEILNYHVANDEVRLTAVFEADGTVPPTIVINEINYKPAISDDYEFVELTNVTDATVDLSGYYFEGIDFTFPQNSNLEPKEYMLITKDKSKYSAELLTMDWNSGDLSDNGEILVLRNSLGEKIDSVNFTATSTWPTISNGKTLELIRPELDNSKATNWQASYLSGGTPGVANIFPITNLYINEFLADNEIGIVDEQGDHEDWVELYNGNDFPVDIGGLYISDKEDEPLNFQIADNALEETTIGARQYLLLWCDEDLDDGPLHVGIKLSKSGENILITQKIGEELITIDQYSFDEQEEDVSFGRTTDGGDVWTSFAEPTPGASNEKTEIDDKHENLPSEFKLSQNYPNPFNPSTKISYQLAMTSKVKLSVYNMLGQKVAMLVNNQIQSAGYYNVNWNAENFSSGVYLILFEAGNYSEVKKTLLMK